MQHIRYICKLHSFFDVCQANFKFMQHIILSRYMRMRHSLLLMFVRLTSNTFFQDRDLPLKMKYCIPVCVCSVCVVLFMVMNASHSKPYGSERASTRKVVSCNYVRFLHYHTVLNNFYVHKTISKVALFFKCGCVQLLIWNTGRVYLFWIFFFFYNLRKVVFTIFKQYLFEFLLYVPKLFCCKASLTLLCPHLNLNVQLQQL